MWQYFKAGGPMMWPLLVLALVSLTIIFERMIFWLRARGLVHRKGSLSPTMAQQAVEELGGMKKFLALLDTIITAAPLLGILGTVVGIIRAFQAIGNSGIPDTKAVASGIAEALITTVFGLVIALCTLLPYNYFLHKANRAREQIEKYASSLQVIFQKKQSLMEPIALPAEEAQSKDEVADESLGGLSEKEKRFFLS